MTFLQNCWYVAALSEEVGAAPLSRTLLGAPVVIYRTEAGAPVMLADRCPHRFAPLHKGRVFGDAIRCPYHGLRFGPDGRCVENPLGNGHVPPAARVASYRLHEVDGFIWAWFGDKEPDVSRIERFPELDDPEWASFGSLIEMQAAYTLVSDNLLDLSHAEFLHPDLVTEGYSQRGKLVVTQEEDSVIANNFRPQEPIATAQRLSFGADAPEHIDRTSIITWNAPAYIKIEFRDAPVGQPERARRIIAAHLITPESDITCHYFFRAGRDFLVDNDEVTDKMRALATKAFTTEDKPMIEAQQRYMGLEAFEDLKPLLLPSDTAAVRARRVLARKLAEQNAGRLNAAAQRSEEGRIPEATSTSS